MKNGWANGESRTTAYLIDIISLSNFFDAAIIKKTAILRANGLSYSDISRATNLSKSKIFRLLKSQSGLDANPKSRLNTSSSYGYVFLKGELVPDPKEQNVIHIILQHWQDGSSFKTIAQLLNRQKLTTKTGKPWTYFAVRAVIHRHTSHNPQTKEKS